MNSQRRYYLDKFFQEKTNNLKGEVLDIGGKKINKRGNFIPNLNLKVYYLNNDLDTNPEYHLDANNFNVQNKEFDYFFLAEVLEHLEYPEQCLKSAYKVIKKGGLGFISMPFLYRKHDDPKDYQRWTDTKLQEVLKKINFKIVGIYPMGGLFCVINDFWMFSSLNSKKNFLGILNKTFFKILSPVLKFLDKKTLYLINYITSGWFIIVQK